MDDNSFSVRDYLRIVFRRKWALILPAVAGVLLVAPVWLMTTPRYRAVASVRRLDYAAMRSSPASLISGGAPHVDIRALKAELFAWPNLQDIIVETKQDVGLQTPADWQSKYSELQEALDVDAEAQSRGVDIIQFAAVHTEPKLAADLANTAASNYVELSKERQSQGGESAIRFLRTEMENYRDKLREVEEELDTYRQEHYSDLPNVKDGIRRRMLSLRIEKESRELQLQEARSKLEEVLRQLGTVPKTSRSEVMREQNPVAVDLEEQLRQRRRAHQLLSVQMEEAHPRFRKLKDEIATLEEQLAETPQWIEVSEKEVANPQYQQLLTNEANLEQEIKGYQAALSQIQASIEANRRELDNVMKQESQYNDLVRKQGEYQQLYSQYRGQLNEAQRRAKVQQDDYVAKVEMLARALTPEFPYRTPKYKVALMCIMAGLAAGVALMFGLEFCDRSFRNIEDAKNYLEVPVLASISTIVSEQERRTRRRTKLLLAGGASVLLLACVAGAWYWRMQDPAGFAAALNRIKRAVNQFVG